MSLSLNSVQELSNNLSIHPSVGIIGPCHHMQLNVESYLLNVLYLIP